MALEGALTLAVDIGADLIAGESIKTIFSPKRLKNIFKTVGAAFSDMFKKKSNAPDDFIPAEMAAIFAELATSINAGMNLFGARGSLPEEKSSWMKMDKESIGDRLSSAQDSFVGAYNRFMQEYNQDDKAKGIAVAGAFQRVKNKDQDMLINDLGLPLADQTIPMSTATATNEIAYDLMGNRWKDEIATFLTGLTRTPSVGDTVGYSATQDMLVREYVGGYAANKNSTVDVPLGANQNLNVIAGMQASTADGMLVPGSSVAHNEGSYANIVRFPSNFELDDTVPEEAVRKQAIQSSQAFFGLVGANANSYASKGTPLTGSADFRVDRAVKISDNHVNSGYGTTGRELGACRNNNYEVITGGITANIPDANGVLVPQVHKLPYTLLVPDPVDTPRSNVTTTKMSLETSLDRTAGFIATEIDYPAVAITAADDFYKPVAEDFQPIPGMMIVCRVKDVKQSSLNGYMFSDKNIKFEIIGTYDLIFEPQRLQVVNVIGSDLGGTGAFNSFDIQGRNHDKMSYTARVDAEFEFSSNDSVFAVVIDDMTTFPYRQFNSPDGPYAGNLFGVLNVDGIFTSETMSDQVGVGVNSGGTSQAWREPLSLSHGAVVTYKPRPDSSARVSYMNVETGQWCELEGSVAGVAGKFKLTGAALDSTGNLRVPVGVGTIEQYLLRILPDPGAWETFWSVAAKLRGMKRGVSAMSFVSEGGTFGSDADAFRDLVDQLILLDVAEIWFGIAQPLLPAIGINV